MGSLRSSAQAHDLGHPAARSLGRGLGPAAGPEPVRVTLLRVESLEARHGLFSAVRGVSLDLAAGETMALVGANGSGKTTLLRTIAGSHPAAAGSVLLDGADVTRLPSHRRVGLGIALVPEGRRLFPGLTVEENLRVAATRARPGRWDVDTLVDLFPLLGPLRRRPAATL